MKFNLDTNKLFIIAGPCVVESEEIVFETATKLKDICQNLDLQLIFKSSYRKANRSKVDAFTGIGDEKAIAILKKVKQELNLPICTDVHESTEVELIKDVADIIQIPAFLCRQTELLKAAAKTGAWVNVKKAQFLSADAMQNAIDKVNSVGNNKVMLTERGTSFGYGDLVVDFRNILKLKELGAPVILDITHSVQQPNVNGATGGQPKFITTLAKAGVVNGVDGLFLETHPKPEIAKSDGTNMLQINDVEPLLKQLLQIRKLIDTF